MDKGGSNASLKFFNTLKYVTIKDEEANSKSTTDILDLKWNPVGSKLAYSRTNKALYAAEYNGVTSVLNRQTVIKDCHANSVECISWDPHNECILATVGSDNWLKTWNLKSKKSIIQVKIPGKGKLVAYSPNGKYLSTVSRVVDEDSNISTYHLLIINLEHDYTLASDITFDKYVYSFSWGTTDNIILVGFEDGTVALYNIRPVDIHLELLHTINASVSCINAVAYDPRGQYIIIGSHEGIISIWSTKSLACVRTLASVDEPVMSLDISQDGSFLAATFENGSNSRIYNIEYGTEILEVKGSKGSEYNIAKLAFRTKPATFAYSTANGEVITAVKEHKGY